MTIPRGSQPLNAVIVPSTVSSVAAGRGCAG